MAVNLIFSLLFRTPVTASHEIDGVRKEKERLTAAWTSHTFGLTAHFSFPCGGSTSPWKKEEEIARKRKVDPCERSHLHHHLPIQGSMVQRFPAASKIRSLGGSGCNVRTQDPENLDEEVKSLVTAWRLQTSSS